MLSTCPMLLLPLRCSWWPTTLSTLRLLHALPQVDFCHRSHKVLQDLRLSNVLLSIPDGQLPLLKLADFSCSCNLSNRQQFAAAAASQVGCTCTAYGSHYFFHPRRR